MKMSCSNRDLAEVEMPLCRMSTMLWIAILNLSLDLVHEQKREFLLRIASQLMFHIGKRHLLLVTGQFVPECQNPIADGVIPE